MRVTTYTYVKIGIATIGIASCPKRNGNPNGLAMLSLHIKIQKQVFTTKFKNDLTRYIVTAYARLYIASVHTKMPAHLSALSTRGHDATHRVDDTTSHTRVSARARHTLSPIDHHSASPYTLQGPSLSFSLTRTVRRPHRLRSFRFARVSQLEQLLHCLSRPAATA